MAKPELYLTSSNDIYGGTVREAFHGSVGFVPKEGLFAVLSAIGKRYPHGTLMAVDDQPSVKEIYELDLRGSGMALDFHEDPQEALQALGNATPDVIISDVQMPGMNGIEFMRKVLEIYDI